MITLHYSKHTFFKGVLRNSKNFRNVSLTCAKRHQMAQISYMYEGLFPHSKFGMPADSPLATDVVEVQSDPNIRRFYLSLGEKAVIPKKIFIYGTEYGIGQTLILKKMSLGVLTVGVIKAIGFANDEVSFNVSSYVASQSKLGYYVSSKLISLDETVKYSSLWDYYPLHRVGSSSKFTFSLHHFVSSGVKNLEETL